MNKIKVDSYKIKTEGRGKGHPVKTTKYILECTVCDGVNNLLYEDIKEYFVVDDNQGYSVSFVLCKKIFIPNSVCYIEPEVFMSMVHCSFIISPDNPTYEMIDDTLFSKDKKRIIAYLGYPHSDEKFVDYLLSNFSGKIPLIEYVKKYVVPDSVEVIEKYAFYCAEIENIILGDNVLYIMEGAFSYSKISSIEINHKLKYIGGRAFYCCTKFIFFIILYFNIK